jgi:hypothetical protein
MSPETGAKTFAQMTFFRATFGQKWQKLESCICPFKLGKVVAQLDDS